MKHLANPSRASAAAHLAAMRSVALFEAFKGAVVLMAAGGLLSLIHRNVHVVAVNFIAHMHLNPASHYPLIFIDAASKMHDRRLVLLAIGACAYAFIRFFEAYGLYTKKAWAQVLAAVSGAIYVPFEVIKLVQQPTWHQVLFLTINILIVTLMIWALIQRRKNASHHTA
jgi:uncharacterized membrane protein (DUF2068 family)